MKDPKFKIAEIDYLLTGTIGKRYGRCGKPACRCMEGREHWHGPYYIWTKKENNKTITKSLSNKQVVFCKKAIANMKILKIQIEIWKINSAKVLENLENMQNICG